MSRSRRTRTTRVQRRSSPRRAVPGATKFLPLGPVSGQEEAHHRLTPDPSATYSRWHADGANHRGRRPVPPAQCGEWRSLVARSVRDAEVGGSSPLSPTITSDRKHTVTDQALGHHLGNVTGCSKAGGDGSQHNPSLNRHASGETSVTKPSPTTIARPPAHHRSSSMCPRVAPPTEATTKQPMLATTKRDATGLGDAPPTINE